MKVIKKEKQLKEVDVTIEEYTACDKCNEKIETKRFDVFKCQFIHKTGEIYPEGGSGELEAMDLCQTCACILIDLLRENGYKVNSSDWDC